VDDVYADWAQAKEIKEKEFERTLSYKIF